jgi:predicted ester cyclase
MSDVSNSESSRQLATNKATVRRLQEAINTDDLNVIRTTIHDLVAPDAVTRTPLPIDATGPDLLVEVFTRLLQAFPDLRVNSDNMIAEGDQVVSSNTVTGTNLGQYMGRPATGTFVTYREMFLVRFAGGRIVETSGIVDTLSLMTQLGTV